MNWNCTLIEILSNGNSQYTCELPHPAELLQLTPTYEAIKEIGTHFINSTSLYILPMNVVVSTYTDAVMPTEYIWVIVLAGMVAYAIAVFPAP